MGCMGRNGRCRCPYIYPSHISCDVMFSSLCLKRHRKRGVKEGAPRHVLGNAPHKHGGDALLHLEFDRTYIGVTDRASTRILPEAPHS